uniref:Transmembrane protein n=1 Tax=Dulem virus 42 TaxID=3145760 RepID=A0AAU8BAT3_9CAUD
MLIIYHQASQKVKMRESSLMILTIIKILKNKRLQILLKNNLIHYRAKKLKHHLLHHYHKVLQKNHLKQNRIQKQITVLSIDHQKKLKKTITQIPVLLMNNKNRKKTSVMSMKKDQKMSIQTISLNQQSENRNLLKKKRKLNICTISWNNSVSNEKRRR